jgi:hypothetical protein
MFYISYSKLYFNYLLFLAQFVTLTTAKVIFVAAVTTPPHDPRVNVYK